MNDSILAEIKAYASAHYQDSGWFRIRCMTDCELRELLGDADGFGAAYLRCQQHIVSLQQAAAAAATAAKPGFVAYIRDYSNAPARIGRKDWRVLDQLTDEQLAEVLASATTEKQAWSLARAWIRAWYRKTAGTADAPELTVSPPAGCDCEADPLVFGHMPRCSKRLGGYHGTVGYRA